MAIQPQTRGNKITSIVLGIFLCVSGVAIAVVSLTGILPAGKSNSPITWVATIALVVLGALWLIVGLKAPLKR